MLHIYIGRSSYTVKKVNDFPVPDWGRENGKTFLQCTSRLWPKDAIFYSSTSDFCIITLKSILLLKVHDNYKVGMFQLVISCTYDAWQDVLTGVGLAVAVLGVLRR